MGDWNSKNNRVVWVDVPVVNLDRAIAFYAAMLNNSVTKEEMEGSSFGILDHKDGNGGCLIPKEGEVSASTGVLVYFNVVGRIRDAVRQVEANGGIVDEDVCAIGPHGFRAVVVDSEGNRLALHSTVDG